MMRIIPSFCLAAVVSSLASAQCSPNWLAGSGRAGPPFSDLFAVHDAGNGPTLYAANTWSDAAHPLWFWNSDHWQDAGLSITGGLVSMASVTIEGLPALMIMGGQTRDGSAHYFTGILQNNEWMLYETAQAGWTTRQIGDEILSIKPTSDYWSPSALHRWTDNRWEAISGAIDGATIQLIETPFGLCTVEANYSIDPPQLRMLCLRPGQLEWEVLGAVALDLNRNNDWNRLSWYRDRLVLAGSFGSFEGVAGPVVAYTPDGWESLGFDAGGDLSGVWTIDGQLVVAHAMSLADSTTLLSFVNGRWVAYLRDGLGNFSSAEADGSGWITNLLTVQDGRRDQLIATGAFDRAARTPAMNAAILDRNVADAAWAPFGGGTSGAVTRLAGTDHGVVALGPFTQLENAAVSLAALQRSETAQWEPLVHSIRYDNSQFLPGWVDPISYQGKLVVAGSFLEINGTDANYIATIEGTTTSPLSSGMRRTASIYSNNESPITGLTVYGGNLIACGTFSEAGGLATGPLAAWNGREWASIGNVTHSGEWPPHIRVVTVFDGELVIAGDFDYVDGVEVRNIARFDGQSWHAMGEINSNGYIVPVTNGARFVEYQHRLLLSNGFASLSNTVPLIQEWNGGSWIPFSFPLPGVESPAISHMAIVHGALLVCGADGWQAYFARIWNGYEWHSLPAVDGRITDSVMDGDTMIVCGYFANTSAGTSQSLARIRCLCPADFNADSTLDFTDYLDFVSAFAANNAVTDFNSDGTLDLFDYLDFVGSFAAGC